MRKEIAEKVFVIILWALIVLEIIGYGKYISDKNKIIQDSKVVSEKITILQNENASYSKKLEELRKKIDDLDKSDSILSSRITINENDISKIKKSLDTNTATDINVTDNDVLSIEATEEEPPETVDAAIDDTAQYQDALESDEAYVEEQSEESAEAPVEEVYEETPPEEQYYEEAPASDNANDNGMTYYGAINCTAYTHTGANTASGVYPTAGVTVASNDLPFGTVIYIEGYGERVVQDTGYMPWASLDLFFDTEEECIQFGEKVLDVYIVN